ncbi:signal transduction histidine kinase, LytS [Fibrisoma limi BUZ 3]|uniref:Signal transduction histidine kinase, LytS n=1 Tax=Fibrisoma limi BUZ 3 TaxID=1185876 RepID=I2GB59_9BACT|nr:histidine kinase [Fibrisoma limi]CCH51131.1 signal transduction histidine kinase, LytS [Fibrisoma limi BUZ 3]
MTREQLIGTINKNGRRLKMRASDLAGFDFSNLDLTGADLRFSNLSRSNFRGTILRQADLSFSDLSDADFTDADLFEANLSFSGLEGATLTGANVEGARFNFSGRSNFRPEPIRPEPITLTTLLQQPGWGLLIGMSLGALLNYGTNSVIFFTNLINSTQDQLMAGLYRYLIIQNALDGVLSFLLAWSMLTWLTRRFKTAWMRHLIISVAALVAFFAINTTLYTFFGKTSIQQLMQRPTFASENAPWYFYALGNLLIANTFLYILQQGRQLTRKLSDQEFQLLNLEKMKTRAELDALQAKINPHFLYNALNSIASLVHDDPDRAEEMTLLLSKLFRYSTGRDGELFSSIADELEMVRTYLQVEQVRFGDRLSFSVSISNPALNELRLPQFLLQPIVENAIKHGIAKRADSGRIDVRIYEQDGYLHLCVHDNGPDFADTMSGGYGLRSIQDKLKLLYGDDAQVELQNNPLKQVLLLIRMSRLQQTSQPTTAAHN